MNLYYGNYQLDEIMPYEPLDPEDEKLLNASVLIADYNFSIRQSAKSSGYSKSQLHRLIHSNLRMLSFELYKVVLKRLKTHKKGGI